MTLPKMGKYPRLVRGGGCRPPPHRAEPLPDSPATMGGAHQLSSTPGWRLGGLLDIATPCRAISGLARDSGRCALASEGGCRSPPHRAEPFPDSPTTVGGAHRLACVGRRHTVRSRTRTRPQRWEVRTDQRVSVAATPRGAVAGIARDGGWRAPSRCPRSRSLTADKPAAKLRTPHHC
jgi:hypothetical protein